MRAFPPAAVLLEKTAPALQLCGVLLALGARLCRLGVVRAAVLALFVQELPGLNRRRLRVGRGAKAGTTQSTAIVSAMVLTVRRRRASRAPAAAKALPGANIP